MSVAPEDRLPEDEFEATVPAEDQTPLCEDEQAKEEVEAWKDRALRAQAEMANMRRRLDTEVEQRTRRRLEGLLHDLIMVGDHIGLALGSIPEPVRAAEGADGFLLGMDAIRTAFEGVLRQHGLEQIAPQADAEFDPALHEAVHTETEDGLKATRLELMRCGYRIGNHVIRPAQVRIVQPA
jgi:molecular chaperone GrpE